MRVIVKFLTNYNLGVVTQIITQVHGIFEFLAYIFFVGSNEEDLETLII